jgi:hypothetical protein
MTAATAAAFDSLRKLRHVVRHGKGGDRDPFDLEQIAKALEDLFPLGKGNMI